MIYHCIRYTIDRHKLADFEAYARRWMGVTFFDDAVPSPSVIFCQREVWVAPITSLLPFSDSKAWLITNSIVPDLVMIPTRGQIWRRRKTHSVF